MFLWKVFLRKIFLMSRFQMQLMWKIKEWIDDFFKDANNYDDSGVGETWCESKYSRKEKMEGIDKEWCTFIFENLWRIQKISPHEGEMDIGKELQAHVYCAIMRVWLHLYVGKYCGAKEVMEHAAHGVNTLCDGFTDGIMCYKCEYGELKSMKVGGVDALKYIWGKTKGGKGLIREAYSKMDKDPCPQEYSKSGKGEGIWKDMKEVFNDMMDNIQRDGFNDKGYCSERGWNPKTKELCKILLRLQFWIDGLVQKWEGVENWGPQGYFHWVKREDNNITPKKKELQSYYRCLLGKVTMMKMLLPHCDLNKVVDVVQGGVDGIRKTRVFSDGNQLCKGLELKSLKMGGRLIWQQISEWIDNYTNKWKVNRPDRDPVGDNTLLYSGGLFNW
ncbi:SICA antigen [Plasmodium coatneyi]|uniref:SICA antigen n=1 Tax=Plasmodium coatneyi TaxID=208452 RepID=A0A1B1DY04_9APIC|nr:SICA antigen [Plasmodium coatneyi]ANQ07487.1 SICA antigen [Plasmodium coatneyi]